MKYSESDKFNDRVFGTGWLVVGLLLLWMGFYVIAALPQQHYGDIAYFVSLIFVLLGTHQVRKGRGLKATMPIVILISNLFYILSFILYMGCLIWFKLNLERLAETGGSLKYLTYVIVSVFVCLTIGILLNFTPLELIKRIKGIKLKAK